MDTLIVPPDVLKSCSVTSFMVDDTEKLTRSGLAPASQPSSTSSVAPGIIMMQNVEAYFGKRSTCIILEVEYWRLQATVRFTLQFSSVQFSSFSTCCERATLITRRWSVFILYETRKSNAKIITDSAIGTVC